LVAHDRPDGRDGLLDIDLVLDFCRGRVGVNVELKCEGSEGAARDTGLRIGARLARRGDADVYVSSFWWTALDAVREAAPAVRRALDGPPPPGVALVALVAGDPRLVPRRDPPASPQLVG